MENPLFKCGRCHHLFRQFPGATPPPESAPAPSRKSQARAPEPDTLEFIFPDRQPAELLVADAPRVEPEAEPARAAAAPPAPRAAAPRVDEPPLPEATEVATALETVPLASPPPPPVIVPPELDAATAVVDRPLATAPIDPVEELATDEADDLGSEVLAESLEEDEPELFVDEARDEDVAADEFDMGDDEELDDEEDDDVVEPLSVDTGRRVKVEDVMKAPAGFGTIMRAMGTMVTGFAALALMIRVAPERTTALLAHLPVAGKTFAHDRNLASKVELANVQGRFQRLRNARRVFVISGDARNNSGMTIERIEVAGALYGLGGGELDQKIVTTGNRTTLTDLSEAEIALLQRLDPVIALAPGETTPFLIVFLEPPRELREFSSRVLSVRPTRRASNPPAEPHRGPVG